MLYYKPDWHETRHWLTGWWNREIQGHWALAVQAPREKPLPIMAPPTAPSDQRVRWLDSAGNFARAEAEMARTFYGGCAFPYVTAGLGPGCLNLYLGCEADFAAETVWYKPCIKDPAQADLRWNDDNSYWQWTLATTRLYKQLSTNKCLTAIPDIIEGIDVLSELLGTEELLTYLIDCPEEIHRLLRQLDDLYFKAFDPLFDITRDECGGNAFIAFNAWGTGRTLKSQCDFSAMISADMFAEFVCPYLERQCARVDFSTYHLDGPQAIHHLDLLLKVPSLKAIQWTPGSPNPPPTDRVWWNKVWKKVYAAGKSAMVLLADARQVEAFVKEFGQKGTFVWCEAQSEREARKMLDDSVNWGA